MLFPGCSFIFQPLTFPPKGWCHIHPFKKDATTCPVPWCQLLGCFSKAFSTCFIPGCTILFFSFKCKRRWNWHILVSKLVHNVLFASTALSSNLEVRQEREKSVMVHGMVNGFQAERKGVKWPEKLLYPVILIPSISWCPRVLWDTYGKPCSFHAELYLTQYIVDAVITCLCGSRPATLVIRSLSLSPGLPMRSVNSTKEEARRPLL